MKNRCVSLALAIIGTMSVNGQTLPDAPLPTLAAVSRFIPLVAAKPHRQLDRTEWVLLTADAGSRALDVYSTHQTLANGNRELFLPTAIAKRPAAMGSLEAVDVTAVWWISRKLEAHHRPRLAHLLTAVDFAQDAPWAIHNLFLPKPTGTVLTLRCGQDSGVRHD
jgi:hypothetical protein